jgi:hypothetical protein
VERDIEDHVLTLMQEMEELSDKVRYTETLHIDEVAQLRKDAELGNLVREVTDKWDDLNVERLGDTWEVTITVGDSQNKYGYEAIRAFGKGPTREEALKALIVDGKRLEAQGARLK